MTVGTDDARRFDAAAVKAVLLDSDGLLVDTERLFFEATRTAFASAGVPLLRDRWARRYLGEGLRSRQIAEEAGVPPALLDGVLARRDGLFWRRVDGGVPLLPGVEEALGRLSRRFRLAVVTGASRRHFDRVHASTTLARFFEAVIACEDRDMAKPDPRGYIEAMRTLSLRSDECVAVEDSPRGAAAATAAGIHCVVVPTELTDLGLCPAGCTILEGIHRLPAMLGAADG